MPTPEMSISVLASKFQQPIADLIVRLTSRPYIKPDRSSSNFYECGYSASAIILIVAMLESMIQRDRYFFKKSFAGAKTKSVAHQYLSETLRYRRHAHIQELFELRNALAHNHVWEIEYTWPKTGGRRHKQSSLVADTHRLSVIPPRNAKIPRTKLVKFNLLPSRIDRTDLAKALSVAVHLLEFLSRKGTNPTDISISVVALPSRRLPFSSLLQEVENGL